MARIDNVQFVEHHLPGMKSGMYAIEVSQQIAGKDAQGNDFAEPAPWTARQSFFVSGERFTLNPADIYAEFPPKGNAGEHENVLPHILFNRSTLPWERLVRPIPAGAGTAEVQQIESHPWMALLLFDESELNSEAVQIPPTAELETLRNFLKLPEEPGEKEHAKAKVNVLKVKEEWLRKIIPSEADLNFLSHVRSGYQPDGTPFERTTLFANRMPQPGRKSFVHLVSLEGRYGTDHQFDYRIGKDEAGYISLVSLHEWHFSCPDTEAFKVTPPVWARLLDAGLVSEPVSPVSAEKVFRGKEAFLAELVSHNLIEADASARDPQKMKVLLRICHLETETFKGLVNHLSRGNFEFPVEAAPAEAKPYLQSGSLPLPHHLREGSKTISWYRSPFMPASSVSGNEDLNLPVRNADQLLRYDTATGMYDSSYAAAWELGRLLSLKNKPLSLKIFEWKRAHAHSLKHAEQVLVHSHLPFTDRDFGVETDANRFASIRDYFGGLSLLKGVPFHYLVPDESYLPRESIRFFQVDTRWVECLIDGAFSIGRVSQFDLTRDQRVPQSAHHPQLSGVLIRSDAVAGWPDLKVEGYDVHITNGDFIPPTHALMPPLVIHEQVSALRDALDLYEVPDAVRTGIEGLSEDLTLSSQGGDAWQLIDNTHHRYYLIRLESDGGLHVYAQDQLPLLRFERLSPNVLLCLFKGVVRTLDVHLPAEGLHFGFTRPFGEHPDYYKELKHLSGENAGKKIEGKEMNIWWKDESLRTIDAGGLAGAMQGALEIADPKDFSPAHFAVEMIEGVPKIRFVST